MSAAKAVAWTAVAAAILAAPTSVAGAPAARAGGASTTYRDAVGDAGRAPDIAVVDVRAIDAAAVAVTVTLAEPTELGRSGWIVIGLDTDRNQRSGGMHGSEVVVLANGELVVLHRLGGGYSQLEARRSGSELAFRLQLADIGVRAFDFAVATLRQDADVAPDRGVFSYPLGPSQHSGAPAGGSIPPGKR